MCVETMYTHTTEITLTRNEMFHLKALHLWENMKLLVLNLSEIQHECIFHISFLAYVPHACDNDHRCHSYKILSS